MDARIQAAATCTRWRAPRTLGRLAAPFPKRALPRLSGKTMGLIGLGRIGRAVVPRAQGLGLKVIAHDPLADPEFAAQFGVKLCTFEETGM